MRWATRSRRSIGSLPPATGIDAGGGDASRDAEGNAQSAHDAGLPEDAGAGLARQRILAALDGIAPWLHERAQMASSAARTAICILAISASGRASRCRSMRWNSTRRWRR